MVMLRIDDETDACIDRQTHSDGDGQIDRSISGWIVMVVGEKVTDRNAIHQDFVDIKYLQNACYHSYDIKDEHQDRSVFYILSAIYTCTFLSGPDLFFSVSNGPASSM